MDNFVGKRIDGRYEIQEVIGVGGMAVVYKAYDNIDDRIVAVKILKEEFLENEEFRRKFKNESKAIAVLNHPNIVKVYDVSFGDKIQYIVMEYVNGITLKEYISNQGMATRFPLGQGHGSVFISNHTTLFCFLTVVLKWQISALPDLRVPNPKR